MERNGIPSEDAYPYCCGTHTPNQCYACLPTGYNETECGRQTFYCEESWNEQHCPSDDWQPAATITDWMRISENEHIMAASLVELGPLSVALDAEMLGFYQRGIYFPQLCKFYIYLSTEI